MTAELARAGGPLAAAGLAVLLLAPGRRLRLAGLGAWAAGGALLLVHLLPTGRPALLAAALAGGAVAAVPLAAAFLRWPWLVALGVLAAAPARVPIELGGEEASLLLPLYAIVAGAALALGWALARGDERARELEARPGSPARRMAAQTRRRIAALALPQATSLRRERSRHPTWSGPSPPSRDSPSRPLGILAWPAAAFVAWTGLSLVWSDDLRKGAIALAAFYLPFGLLALVVARLPWSRRWLTALLVQLVAMALVFASVGVYQWVTRDVFWNPRVIVGNAYAPFYRVNSIFWDPSVYGRFLVVAILALLVLAVFGAGRRVALAATAALAATWIGLVLSFSQSSFAALVAGVLAAAMFAWGRRAILGLALVAVVLVAVGFAAPQVRAELDRDLDRVTSGRAGLVENGLRIAADHPAHGVGVGGFEQAYADRTGRRGDEPRRAASHTTPVTIAAETGLAGVVLFGWFLGAALVAAFRGASRSFRGRASLIVGLAVLAIAVHSLAYDAFVEDPMTWALAGLAALGARRREEEE